MPRRRTGHETFGLEALEVMVVLDELRDLIDGTLIEAALEVRPVGRGGEAR